MPSILRFDDKKCHFSTFRAVAILATEVLVEIVCVNTKYKKKTAFAVFFVTSFVSVLPEFPPGFSGSRGLFYIVG